MKEELDRLIRFVDKYSTNTRTHRIGEEKRKITDGFVRRSQKRKISLPSSVREILFDNISMNSDWSSLPDIIWYRVCEYLPDVNDIFNLSSTNRKLNETIENDLFWRNFIRKRFGRKILRRYCDEMFENQNRQEYLFTSKEHLAEFEKQYFQLPVAILRNGWNLIVTGAQNGNLKGFAAAKRAKFHLPKLVSKLKMSIDENVFREKFANHSNPNECLSKLIFLFLSKKIRLSFAQETFRCFDISRHEESQLAESILDDTSFFGRCAVFESRWLAALRGQFSDILPGRYGIFCRVKLILLRSEQPSDEDQFTGEFTCIPEFGVMSSIEFNVDWFDSHYSKNYSQQNKSLWFEEQMGTITVYEISTIFFGLRFWQIPYRKYTVLCDFIELKIIE